VKEVIISCLGFKVKGLGYRLTEGIEFRILGVRL
jgi:hypothetical protein